MLSKDMKNKLLLITYGVLLFVFLMNYAWIINAFKVISKIFMPFVIGAIMAFMLNVLVKSFEHRLLSKMKLGKRVLSIVMSLALVIGFMAFILLILIPQVKNAGMLFIDNIPKYQENIYNIGKKVGLNEEELEMFDLENNKLRKEITSVITENSESIINMSMGFAGSIFSAICDFFIGFVFAIYILLDKENLVRQFKKLLRKICSSNKKVYEFIVDVCKLSNTVFGNFVKVQVFEAFVLGTLCFLGMTIIGLPYAATISVVVGFTALIPIIGALIGYVVGAFLIFMVNPFESLIFIIFILLLQQIETNFIYPRVVGGRVGLPSIWVLVAVIIGGNLGGVFGMIFAVPAMSVIYSLLRTYVNGGKLIEEN